MSNIATDTMISLSPSGSQKFMQRTVPLIIFAVILAVIPVFGPSRTMYSLLNAMGVNIVFAMSYNMLLGRAGLLSFGHAVYFGLGGYAAVHAMGAIEAASYGDGGFWAGYPVFFLPFIGFAGGALAGAVIGWPSCRRAGTPFAMISLGVAELISAAGFMFGSIFGGEEGISGDRMNGPEMFGLSLGPINEVYWFIAFWTFIGVLGIYAFTRTPLGKMSEATRDNPERAEFVGYDPQKVRYLVFIFAGGFAGLAGGMSAVNYEIFTPEALSLAPSGMVLLMAYIGGIRYFAGPILGAILLTYMQSMMSDYSEAWLLYLGLLFIVIVMFAPGGLAGIFGGLFRGLRGDNPAASLRQWAVQITGIVLMMISLVTLIEMSVNWSNNYGEVFEPFGMHLPHDGVLTWAVIFIPFVAGVGILRKALKNKEGQA
ncbi:leucine/isoleucine/valine transporter permease subunit [Thalassovita gelatinovora]|uniref:Leucine/isoleucine/valine transporter permease subunit n=1 Tax=Thalassovita gelatinovora TaxID=53501 RepID=A0A0P1FB91_THAGE|nr:branched-chain amino acid ABC transporter permease [Thalassovita gelatinovora]QIZ80757.1 branched-chain amino acid ABC transporter permease [Thalassovita gelatinovora]CUH65405.1 leucine/isoleucine/valine transporter permease subunit [Thalassovita gelatinovora]SEQ90590.1 amino acid/amide ABC transporter membrane protein 2, HAAT family [Thalassovita gelatinovora]